MNHDAAYVARQIGKTENWVKRHAPELPHIKIGRTYMWDDTDIAEILRLHRHRPGHLQRDDDELRPLGRRSA